jgi:DNA-binding response OmpR family regulator
LNTAGPRPRVVVVDDDATIRRFVALVLEEMPLELVVCADAPAAREALRQAPAVLLITDLMMPGESGFELLASLVAEPTLRGRARLAVFSAGLNAGTHARLAELDVWRELDKPVSVAALEACVEEALSLARAEAGEDAGATVTASMPAPGSASRPLLSAADRATVARLFGGDTDLFLEFRAQALLQFVHDRQALAAALAAADGQALRRQAHSLKGALATLGDDTGSALARALEDMAATRPGRDTQACEAAWAQLDAHLAALLA